MGHQKSSYENQKFCFLVNTEKVGIYHNFVLQSVQYNVNKAYIKQPSAQKWCLFTGNKLWM